jgi:hypothetical protein
VVARWVGALGYESSHRISIQKEVGRCQSNDPSLESFKRSEVEGSRQKAGKSIEAPRVDGSCAHAADNSTSVEIAS